MGRREYGQECSLACALDRVGERWSLLIVRELSLGPLRFSALAHDVGGAPTDVLTKRLRDLEGEGIVARRELPPPAAGTVYELTELGRGLERPMIELARWGMELQKVDDVVGLLPSSLPNALRVILRPPFEATFALGLRSGGESFLLHARDGWIDASRGSADGADVILAGTPIDVIAALVVGEEAERDVALEGNRSLLSQLRGMVVIPKRLRAEAEAFAQPVGL
jgi:DNA-binding HxlR family transcriptional regulator